MKMAEVETCEKNAATESLQYYFSSLVVAIQDPVLAASELYSVKLVSWPVVEKMPTLGLSKCEKNFQLLSAIHSQLATNPSGIEMFIQVLNAKLDLQEIAKGMEDKYQGELIDHEFWIGFTRRFYHRIAIYPFKTGNNSSTPWTSYPINVRHIPSILHHYQQ